MKILESLRTAWNDDFTQELLTRPTSAPLKVIFPYDYRLKTYSGEEYKLISASKLITNQDVEDVLKLVKEGHSHLNPMKMSKKRCILISSILGINVSALALVIAINIITGGFPPLFILILIFVLGMILSFAIQIFLGKHWLKLDLKRTDDMIYNIEKALDFHNRKLFNRLGYDWQLSEHGAYLSLNVTLHRMHGANSKGKLLMNNPLDGQDLSVIREESTMRVSGDTTALNSEVRNVGTTTGRMTGVIEEEEGDIEEESEEEEEKENTVDVEIKEERRSDDGGRGNWDDFGDVLMSTDRKFQ